MQTLFAKAPLYLARAGEHPVVRRTKEASRSGVFGQAAALFLDQRFDANLAVLRGERARHVAYDAAVTQALRFCLDFGLLHDPATAGRAVDAGRELAASLRDILLFPAYALPDVSEDELAVLGKFWAFVFHVDDEFDERVTAAISKRVEAIERSSPGATPKLELLAAVSAEFEAQARAENADYARILAGGASDGATRTARAVAAISAEFVRVISKRHGVDGAEALALMRPFADAVFRLFDARTAEIRQRVNRHLAMDELEYNAMRLYTIAMEPLLEASFLFLDTTLLRSALRLRKGVAFEQLMASVRLQIAYVNDLVSIAKELREPNLDNIALFPIVEGVGRETLEGLVNRYNEEPDGAARAGLRTRVNDAVNPYLAVAVRDTCGSCNALLAQVVHWSGLLDVGNVASGAVAGIAMSWVRAHYLYVFEIQRYAETIPLVFRVLATGAAPAWDIGRQPPPSLSHAGHESGTFRAGSAEMSGAAGA